MKEESNQIAAEIIALADAYEAAHVGPLRVIQIGKLVDLVNACETLQLRINNGRVSVPVWDTLSPEHRCRFNELRAKLGPTVDVQESR